MNLGLVISLSIVLASLYLLGLIGYRLFLSLKTFQRHQTELRQKIDLLQRPIEKEFLPAQHAGSDELAEVLAKREQFKRAQVNRAQARRHRLVERLQTLDLDKR